ncbi:MAG TPA: tripartite tricarboxylate transporter substrate binding protein [Burkholderiales bacterium]|jgi:tripartite-type tricarboxylate transporter receptor subunit TctC|nr:tripartite tricarboxylate transporter substrate binding protein [Burkholderiales bacterium]
MRITVVLAALVAAAAALPAHAQQYPNRPVTMIVPFPPGGIADITGRPLAVSMAKHLGQPVVVENKAGAGGAVGHAFVAKAKPDGYTIMTALSSIVVIPEADKVNGRPSTYQMSEFTPIALVSADPTILLVSVDSPWKTLKDLIDDAKARPGKISYASSGVYGTIHTCFEMLAQAANVKLLHVPYKGGGPAMTALLAGETNLGAQSPGVSNPHIKSGKIRVLGSWAGSRTAALPDVPTMKEQGYDVEFYIWAGVFAPAGLAPDVRERITGAVRQAAQDPEFVKALANVNTPVNYKEGKDFDAFLETDTKRLAEVVRKMGKTE